MTLQCVFCEYEATWQARGQPLCIGHALMNEGRDRERQKLDYLDYLNTNPELRLSFDDWLNARLTALATEK